MIKKIIMFLSLGVVLILCVASILLVKNYVDNIGELLQTSNLNIADTFLQSNDNIFVDVESGGKDMIKEKEYNVYRNKEIIGSFDQYIEARQFAGQYQRCYITQKGKSRWIWNNYPDFEIYVDGKPVGEESSFKAAFDVAGDYETAVIYSASSKKTIWSNEEEIKNSAIIEAVPLILQNPELPRGCEVTSLAMLLQFSGENVSKMELANRIRKNNAERSVKDGKIYYGNPNNGFIGDMTTFKRNGLGVYHTPVYELLDEYMPNSAIDLTGSDFECVLYYLSMDSPVWVITNTWFKKLPAQRFETWYTEDGPMQITYLEHSVCLVGYDENYIYFNDPLKQNDKGYSKADKDDFIEAWVQMGSQAVSYLK